MSACLYGSFIPRENAHITPFLGDFIFTAGQKPSDESSILDMLAWNASLVSSLEAGFTGMRSMHAIRIHN